MKKILTEHEVQMYSKSPLIEFITIRLDALFSNTLPITVLEAKDMFLWVWANEKTTHPRSSDNDRIDDDPIFFLKHHYFNLAI